MRSFGVAIFFALIIQLPALADSNSQQLENAGLERGGVAEKAEYLREQLKHAENNKNTFSSTGSEANNPRSIRHVLAEVEAKYLTERLESAERYQAELLSTMQWVVGTSFAIVLTITAVVIGLGWYTNFRLYRGDLEKIRHEQEKKYTHNVNALKDEVAHDIEQKIKAGLKEAKSDATKSVRNLIQSAISDLQELKLKMMHMEAKDWERKEVDANALRTLSLAMPVALDVGGQLDVDEVAEEMARILKKGRAIMDGSLAQDLIESISVISKRYPILFESLSAQIKRSVGL